MEDEVRKEGREEAKLELAKNLLDILDDDTIAKKFGLEVEVIRKLREESNIELKK